MDSSPPSTSEASKNSTSVDNTSNKPTKRQISDDIEDNPSQTKIIKVSHVSSSSIVVEGDASAGTDMNNGKATAIFQSPSTYIKDEACTDIVIIKSNAKHTASHRGKRIPWSSQEEENLKRGVKLHGKGNWKMIKQNFYYNKKEQLQT